jgi:type I restriction enzyme, S subunit
MSTLSYMEKLLDGVEVKWLPLEVVAKIKHGKDWKGLNAGDIPVYGSGGIMGYVDRYLCNKPTVLIPRKGSITNIFYVETPLWNVDTIYYTEIDTLSIVPKYFYHFIKTVDLMSLDTGSGRPSLTQAILNKIQIPIPCPDNPEKSLAIQAEIVRILDTFTALTDELTDELTAELTDRKKQYNYYRDRSLSFEKGEVEWKTLGEIGEFTYGYAAKAQDSGDARFVRITDVNINGKLIATNSKYVDISGENERYLLKKDDLLMARTGATYGKTMIFEEDYPAIYAGFLIKLSFDERVITPKFYWHFAQSSFFWDQANRLVSGGGQPQFNANVLKDVKILIPSLEEQARIVSLLDKFDTITASISEGLPREIALRQKQYEYYRDLLLTFPKPEEEQ